MNTVVSYICFSAQKEGLLSEASPEEVMVIFSKNISFFFVKT